MSILPWFKGYLQFEFVDGYEIIYIYIYMQSLEEYALGEVQRGGKRSKIIDYSDLSVPAW